MNLEDLDVLAAKLKFKGATIQRIGSNIVLRLSVRLMNGEALPEPAVLQVIQPEGEGWATEGEAINAVLLQLLRRAAEETCTAVKLKGELVFPPNETTEALVYVLRSLERLGCGRLNLLQMQKLGLRGA